MNWLRFVGVRVAASCALLLTLLAAVFTMSVALIPGDFATVYRLSLRGCTSVSVRETGQTGVLETPS